MNKQYLGDGVYAAFDGYHVWLTAETNQIALEPEVYASLIRYVKTIRKTTRKRVENSEATTPPRPE